jgi:hypothetical protein
MFWVNPRILVVDLIRLLIIRGHVVTFRVSIFIGERWWQLQLPVSSRR